HQAALRRRRDTDDVVEAHHEVRDDHGLDRRHQLVARFDLFALTLVLGDALDTDPDEQHGSDQLDVGQQQQLHREKRQDDAQYDSADHAPENAELPLLLRQIAAGERDDDRVVARQQDVDDD